MTSSATRNRAAIRQRGRRYLSALVRFRRAQLIAAVLFGALLGGGAVAAAGGFGDGFGDGRHGGPPGHSLVDAAGRPGDVGPSGYDR